MPLRAQHCASHSAIRWWLDAFSVRETWFPKRSRSPSQTMNYHKLSICLSMSDSFTVVSSNSIDIYWYIFKKYLKISVRMSLVLRRSQKRWQEKYKFLEARKTKLSGSFWPSGSSWSIGLWPSSTNRSQRGLGSPNSLCSLFATLRANDANVLEKKGALWFCPSDWKLIGASFVSAFQKPVHVFSFSFVLWYSLIFLRALWAQMGLTMPNQFYKIIQNLTSCYKNQITTKCCCTQVGSLQTVWPTPWRASNMCQNFFIQSAAGPRTTFHSREWNLAFI